MVRTRNVVYAKPGTVSTGGMKYTPRVGPIRQNYQNRPNMRQQVAQNTMARGELKSVDFNVNLALGSVLSTTNTNAGIAVCNLIQPGTGSWNRIGKRITMKSIRYRFVLLNICDLSIGNRNNTIRVTLVHDKQSSGNAIPSFNEIFGVTDQAGTESTSSFLDPLRVDNTSRFNVIRDDVVASDNNGIEWEGIMDRYVSLKGLVTTYNGQSAPQTIADISSGALYLVFRGETNAAPSGQWIVQNSTCRLRYYD